MAAILTSSMQKENSLLQFNKLLFQLIKNKKNKKILLALDFVYM